MKNVIRFSIFAVTYFTFVTSCKKKNDDNGTPILPDTLTAGWTKITSLPKADFRDIFFPDNTTGYACGDQGIYKSTDGGINWARISTANYFVNIAAANANRVCFVGNASRPYVTQDGGNTFDSTSYSATGAMVAFNDCFFSSQNTCYFSSNQYIWKSVDGGATLDTLFHFNVSSFTCSLFFLNDQFGWEVRGEGIYRTTDAGITWNLVASYTNAFGAVNFLDQDNGYYGGYGTVYKTTNAGGGWTPVFSPPIPGYNDIAFININEGYCCQGNRLYKTTDAGATWTQVVALGNENFVEIHFNDASHGWACTTDGVVLRFNQ